MLKGCHASLIVNYPKKRKQFHGNNQGNESTCDTIGNVGQHGKRATREQLGTVGKHGKRLSNKGTIGNFCKHGNRATRERAHRRARVRETDGEDDKRSCENLEFCRESLAAAIAHFFFCFCFFLVFSSSWSSYGLRAVCCTVCVCVCVCVCFLWRGRYFEFVILALLFPQCLCCCRLHVF